jgi:hypothetical protein
MQKMKVTGVNPDGSFNLEAIKDATCKCTISNLRFHTSDPVMNLEVVWHNKGKYTNGQRKKLLARTVVSLLRSAVEHQKKLDKHSKGIS